MSIDELIAKNTSKKASVTIATIATLAYLGAHPVYIAAVAIVELLVQGWHDHKPKLKENENELA